MRILDAAATAASLPYPRLADAIGEILLEHEQGRVRVPERTVVDLEEDGKLLVMPAAGRELAITKLVTVHPGNRTRSLPTIQGEVIALRSATGERLAQLEGATVTGRRTAALSLLAARELAPEPAGPLLVFGAGVQARSHIEAFREGLGVERAYIVSRTRSKAEELATHAREMGMDASVEADAAGVVGRVKLIVTATSSSVPVLSGAVADDVLICAVGAFRPGMAELTPELVGDCSVVVDTLEGAMSEAGDLIAAVAAGTWSWDAAQPLANLLRTRRRPLGPLLFKSVGHAMFDLAAARLALQAGE